MRVSVVIVAAMCLLLVGVLVLSGCATGVQADDGLAQRRTRAPGGGVNTPDVVNQRPTLDTSAAQATAQALATSAADLADVPPGMEQTAQAVIDYAESAGANPDAIVATAEFFATQVAVDPATVEAAVSAVLAEIPAEWYAYVDVPVEELEQLLTGWVGMGNVSAQWQGDALVTTVTYTETGLNALIDAALLAGGYAISDLNVDLVPGGAVVDVYGFTSQAGLTGNLSLFMTLAVVEGRVEIDLVSASFAGRQVPLPTLDEVDVLLDDLSDVINETVALVYDVSYTVQALTITDVDFAVTVTLFGVN
jgi:hypothetical protein